MCVCVFLIQIRFPYWSLKSIGHRSKYVTGATKSSAHKHSWPLLTQNVTLSLHIDFFPSTVGGPKNLAKICLWPLYSPGSILVHEVFEFRQLVSATYGGVGMCSWQLLCSVFFAKSYFWPSFSPSGLDQP